MTGTASRNAMTYQTHLGGVLAVLTLTTAAFLLPDPALAQERRHIEVSSEAMAEAPAAYGPVITRHMSAVERDMVRRIERRLDSRGVEYGADGQPAVTVGFRVANPANSSQVHPVRPKPQSGDLHQGRGDVSAPQAGVALEAAETPDRDVTDPRVRYQSSLTVGDEDGYIWRGEASAHVMSLESREIALQMADALAARLGEEVPPERLPLKPKAPDMGATQ